MLFGRRFFILTLTLVLVIAWTCPGLAVEEVRVKRIKHDPTLINHEFIVKGTVEQVQTIGEGIERGQFIFRDAYDGETIMVETDKMPPPGRDVSEFRVKVLQDQDGRIHLKHMVLGGGTGGFWKFLRDPITIIAVAFLLLMGFLVYYLLRSDKAASVSVTPSRGAPEAVQTTSSQFFEADKPGKPVSTSRKETLDSIGNLTVTESMDSGLKGKTFSVVLRDGNGLLGREGVDINIPDESFSAESGQFHIDPGTRKVMLKNIKKGRTLYVTASSGEQNALNLNDEIQIENGDIISQERSTLKLKFQGLQKTTVDA